MKPRIFIGSSSEGLTVAYAIQTNLEFDSETTVWPQGAFAPSDYVLPALLETLDTYDFGIFVFTPDDVSIMRGQETPSVRDNVVFELGLFAGRLGRQRNFIVAPRGSARARLPSDLLGLLTAEYDPNRQDGNLIAATGPACSAMRAQIQKLGERSKPSVEERALVRAQEAVEEPLRLKDLVAKIESRSLEIEQLFQIDTGYSAGELRLLMMAAHADRAIGKWGIIVPLVADTYDLLLHIKFSTNVDTKAYFYPEYVLDATSDLHYRVIYEVDEPPVLIRLGIMNTEPTYSFSRAMSHVRSDLLSDGKHPAAELNYQSIAERTRETLQRSIRLKHPGQHRTDLGPILCFVGSELAVTRNGIEDIYSKENSIPFFAAEWAAGVRAPRPPEPDGSGFYRISSDGTRTLISDEEQMKEYIDRSGLASHTDLPKALEVIRLLRQNQVV